MIAYNNLLTQTQVSYTPRQPNREERSFLKYSPKPAFISFPPRIFENVEFSIQELPIEEFCPRTKMTDINLDSLQVWLDHLGPAIYNPLDVIIRENGSRLLIQDGAHRSRCLWEIGEPMIRFHVQRIVSGWQTKCEEWLAYNLESNSNTYFPTTPRNSLPTTRQYYPSLEPPADILKSFFLTVDGVDVSKKIYSPASFKEIIYSTLTGEFRRKIFETIETKIQTPFCERPSILDVGCNWGYFSLLAWEAGANVTAIDTCDTFIGIIQSILSIRHTSNEPKFTSHNCRLQHLLSVSDQNWDCVFMLNVFHHMIRQLGHDIAWNILKTLLTRTTQVFIMTRNLDNVFNGDPVEAFESHLNQKPEFLYSHGDRRFFIIRGTR